MTSPHTQHAANRAADLALIATSDATLRSDARDLLIIHYGGDVTAADHAITQARAVLTEQGAKR
ncbi:hypothetical protein [Nonomuraea wenchangensis]|uniref:Uncharacterized protein n=1 Tax=Nonomuraea wenchangensis TaxID=568860 RepID=A0A1I0LW39_9ACTN|nr:hypothetical protein [Nonomuraea wenchangensis]SEU46376.1 hypothetical protein SAMN05421811_12716 [Nonomuraea wenchangensis]